jgi:hypothetical protein
MGTLHEDLLCFCTPDLLGWESLHGKSAAEEFPGHPTGHILANVQEIVCYVQIFL